MPRAARNVSNAQAAYAAKVAASLGGGNVSKLMKNKAMREVLPDLSEDMCNMMRKTDVLNKLASNKEVAARVAEASKGVDMTSQEGVAGVLAKLTADQEVMSEIISNSESLLKELNEDKDTKASIERHIMRLTKDKEAMDAVKDVLPQEDGVDSGTQTAANHVQACIVLHGGDPQSRADLVAKKRQAFVSAILQLATAGPLAESQAAQTLLPVVLENEGESQGGPDAVILTVPCLLSKALATPEMKGMCEMSRQAVRDFYNGTGKRVRDDTFLPAGIAFAVGTRSTSLQSQRVIVAPCLPNSRARSLLAALTLAKKHGYVRLALKYEEGHGLDEAVSLPHFRLPEQSAVQFKSNDMLVIT